MDKMRLMLAAAVCVVAASLTFASMGSSSPTIPTAMLAQARSAALQVATGMGDSSPTDISMSGIVTRNEALAAVSGEGQISGALGTTSSYLVVEYGDFTDTDAPIPHGVPDPTGTVLVLVVNSATGVVTDTGLLHNSSALDTSSLGAMTSIASS